MNVGLQLKLTLGRGRTTTGLVCAYLILYKNSKKRDHKHCLDAPPRNPNRNYEKGEYNVIMKLLDHLQCGYTIKQEVDEVSCWLVSENRS